jgi:hypothetical protein
VLTVSYRDKALPHALRLSKTEDPLPLAKEILRQLVDEAHRGKRK